MFKYQNSKCRLISFARLRIGASAHNFPSLSMRAELVREEYLYEPDGSLLTKGFREIYHTALKKPFMLKHFLKSILAAT